MDDSHRIARTTICLSGALLLRSDEKGASIWYESLSRDDRLQTSQSFRPLSQMHWHNATLLVLGVALRDWGGGLDKLLTTCESAADAGNRVVVTLDPENTPKFWRLPASMDVFKKRDLNPAWQKDTLLLKPGSSWKTLRNSSKDVEAIERSTGKGTLVLVSSSTPVTNRGIVRQRDTSLLVSLMGMSREIVFDESHLGVIETGTVLGLARHYRLQGLFVGLLVLCILFVWRNSSAFPPQRPSTTVPRVQDPLDGFAGLLERSLPQDKLIEECGRARKLVERSAQRREMLDGLARSATGPHRALPVFQQMQAALGVKRKSTKILT